ncbi:MAG TPA: hypothetical protein VKB20_09805, partial [Steroidobacteraceae bacterium]|nr:hypothetical protein [Steroidobacteraceae bacterium]
MLNRIVSMALLGAGALALSLGVQLAARADSTAAVVAGSTAAGHAQIGSFGLDLAGGDPSVQPGDDFARYANGHWLDTAQ